MLLIPDNQVLPIKQHEDGVIRVSGTQVTLDAIVRAFNSGITPEEIFMAQRTVPLADIYEVIAFYLHHQPEVDAYLHTKQSVPLEYDLRHFRKRAIQLRLPGRTDLLRRRQD